jgi:Carboxypeptidase regulatory-like domain
MRISRTMIFLGFVLGTCLSLPLAHGQSNNQAGIRGTIADSSGAVIPGAKVSITDVGTNVTQAATADSHGGYSFTALRASIYKMRIESQGFGVVEKTGIMLTVNQQTTLNVALTPSNQETTVTV